MFLILILLGLLFTPAELYPQDSKTDSLLKLLPKTSGEKKLEVLINLCAANQYNPKEGLKYAAETLEYAKDQNNKSYIAKALFQHGNMYNTLDSFTTAMKYYTESLNIARSVNDSVTMSDNYNNMGVIYKIWGSYTKALESYNNAYYLLKNLGHTERLLPIVYNSGLIQYNLGDYEGAKKSFSRCFEMLEVSPSDFGNVVVNLAMGDACNQSGDYPGAEKYYMASESFLEKAGNDYLTIKVSLQQADFYRKIKNKDKALEYARKALELNSSKPGATGDADAVMGSIYLDFNEPDKAAEFFQRSKMLYEKLGYSSELAEVIKKLSEAYRLRGDYKTAYEYLTKYTEMRDSILSQDKLKEIDIVRAQFELDHKNEQLIFLQQKSDLQELKIQNQSNIMMFSAFGIIILSGFLIALIYFNNTKKKLNARLEEKKKQIEYNLTELENQNIYIQNQNRKLGEYADELKKSNQSKEKFLSIIAHDLKNPVHFIMNASEILEDDFGELTEEERSDLIHRLRQSSRLSAELLQDLLTWAQNNMGMMEFNPTEILPENEINSVISLLMHSAENKNISINISAEPGIKVRGDKSMIDTVIRNLISNSIKFTRPGGNIDVIVQRSGNDALITVKDNGTGMGQEEMSRLFRIDVKQTTKGTNDEGGTGLGLIICKEFVERNGGTISVKSRKNEGTEISFTVPLA
ncbi:MAG: ATP-binding protein [Ignavibacteriaceae bacterium]|nr:ATP-binding protein [Ignavibacteriaceae bacterium]